MSGASAIDPRYSLTVARDLVTAQTRLLTANSISATAANLPLNSFSYLSIIEIQIIVLAIVALSIGPQRAQILAFLHHYFGLLLQTATGSPGTSCGLDDWLADSTCTKRIG